MITEPNPLESLPLRRRAVIPFSAEEYQIVAETGEIKEVKANTAYEAFKRSGLSAAIRIERKAMIKQYVLPKERFVEEKAPELTPQEALHSPLQHKSPVLSADDMDSMMQRLQSAHEQLTAAARVDVPSAEVATPDIANSEASVGENIAAPPPVITSPAGLEVHGDGYDEIIPATLPPKQVASTKTMISESKILAAEVPVSEPSEPVAEKELTQDEVNKLLNG